jgi:hypothetical protein
MWGLGGVGQIRGLMLIGGVCVCDNLGWGIEWYWIWKTEYERSIEVALASRHNVDNGFADRPLYMLTSLPMIRIW